LDKTKPYIKFVIGGDYNFSDGSYLNFQFLHGFIHERGNDALNDYLMLRYEKKFFNEKLKLAPLSGGFIVSDWKDIKNNYAFIYAPEIVYQATDNTQISLSAVIFDGKGQNAFATLNNYNMALFKLKHSF
jgi:hypothetical protein